MESDFARLLSRILADRGVSQIELSRRTGISKGAISAYVSGEYEPKQNNLYKIAKALSVPVSALFPVIGGEVKTTKAKHLMQLFSALNDEGRDIVITTAEGLDKSGQYRAENLIEMGDYVETYSIAAAAAGAGAFNDGSESVYHRISAQDIPEHYDAQIDISGDSMEPTIPDGAVAFVEFTLGDPPKNGEIYVFQRGEDTMIKRGFFEDLRWTLRSDNPNHQDIVVTETDPIRIIGRVVEWAVPK